MHRKKIWIVTLVAFMVLALPALAQKKGGGNKKPKSSPADVTFRDGLGDKIRSDNGGAYMNKVAKVSANIGHNFFMKLARSNQLVIRTLFLDFSDCASDSDPTSPDFELCTSPFSQGSTFNASVYATGGGTPLNVQLKEMMVGESNDTLRLRVTFNPDSVGLGLFGPWSLWFDPLRTVSGGQASPLICPNSTLVDVTRTAADTWVIFAGEGDVACLMELNEDTGELESRGRYHMPFQITVQAK